MRHAHIHIRGIVQGVGMRPFVYRTAVAQGVRGWVMNTGDGVHIEAHAEEVRFDAFLHALRDDAPAAARIDDIRVTPLAAQDGGPARTAPHIGEEGFRIIASRDATEHSTLVSPDIATCPDCLHELFDPTDRRYHYPFINCTNCGPRFTIIRSLPYDRAATSMDAFPLCPACAREYADPLNRRFHAQPNACFACGPHLTWREREHAEEPLTGTTRELSDAIIDRCCALLRAGGIVAIKGLGGFHLACDATNEEAVSELRRRKRRPHKPLAAMMPSLELAEQACELDDAERAVLCGSVRPIVLLRRRAAGQNAPRQLFGTGSMALAPSVTLGLSEAGLMLPYTPLQHLLTRAFGRPLVMTSGNLSGNPIETDDALAWQNLVECGVADALLGNDRAILARYDDSVVRIVDGKTLPVRRARGFAPQPLILPARTADDPVGTAGQLPNTSDVPHHGKAPGMPPRCLFASGPEQKSTFAFTREQDDGTAQCFVSQHLGDVEHATVLDAWHQERARVQKLFDLHPTALACDLHPGYLTSQWTRAEAQRRHMPLVEVQHHHAHAAAALAEAGAMGAWNPRNRAIALVFDGTGAGTDGTVWGGEALVSTLTGYERAGHLSPWRLPGGTAAVRDPRRCALGLLDACGMLDHPGARPLLASLGSELQGVALTMARRGINSPLTSSMGRLLDALAALSGVCLEATYEGEPAIAFEAAAWRSTNACNGEDVGTAHAFHLRWQPAPAPDNLIRRTMERVGESAASEYLDIDPRPLVEAVLAGRAAGLSAEDISWQAHDAVVRMARDAALLVRERTGVGAVALSGGVFMNRMILGRTRKLLEHNGFTVLVPSAVPVNDGCIAYGQAAVARERLRG